MSQKGRNCPFDASPLSGQERMFQVRRSLPKAAVPLTAYGLPRMFINA